MNVRLAVLVMLALTSIVIRAQSPFENRLYASAYSPDGNQIAFAGFDTIEIYSSMLSHIATLTIPNETISGIVATPRPVRAAWSPDGTKLAANVGMQAGDGSHSRIMIWDTTTWQLLHTFLNVGSPFVWSGDSTMLAASGYLNVILLDVAQGTRLEQNSPQIISNIRQIAWNPVNASQILILSNTAIEIWDFNSLTGTLPTTYRGDRLIAYSPDGVYFAVTEGSEIQVWDSQSLSLVQTLQGHTQVIEDLSWKEAGILSTALAEPGRVTYIWNLSTGTPNALAPSGEIPASVSPTATTYISKFDTGLSLMDASDNTVIATLIYGNVSPTANVGPDQTITDTDNNGSEAVTLDGSGSSDSDGTIVSYSWRENGIEIATGVNPTIDLAVGVHTITLVVTDDDGATGTDEVVVTVLKQECKRRKESQ